METIQTAALNVEGIILSMPRPNRHHNIFHFMHDCGWWNHLENVPAHKQGFITSEGRFVDRKEGVSIAYAASQILKKHGPETELFSEDCW